MTFFTTEIGQVILPVMRLFLFTIAGFLVFRIELVRSLLLKPFVWVIMNVVFPLYFIHFLPTRWSAGAQAGWVWAGVFLGLYIVYLLVQTGAARLLINRIPIMQTEYPRELLVIFSMHNAGYIPLPIVVALAPAVVSLYLSFYILAFMFLFFTVAVWMIRGSGGGRIRFTVNPPMVGLVAGLVVAATGIYGSFPVWVQTPLRFLSSITLDAVMVVLGAILASIPAKTLRFRREFAGYILFKMVLFPAVVLGILVLIPLRGLPQDVAAGIKLALVLEAVVPPATNIMVITKAYGTDKQVEYAGSAIITSYLAGLVLVPLFLVLSRLLFN